MRRIATCGVVLVVAVGLVGCGGGSGGEDGVPFGLGSTTTAPGGTTSTTSDPAPVIRRYASIVAKADSTLGDRCGDSNTCAMDRATAWISFSNEIMDLADDEAPPGEIADLVDDISSDDGKIRSLVEDFMDCMGEAPIGSVEGLTACEEETRAVLHRIEAAVDDLAAWRPYM